jgi:hypothetical protein
MNVTELSKLSPSQLLVLHADLSDELRDRGVTRSSNNPLGDYAEHLFCKAFEWRQENNAVKAFDAIDQSTNLKYQIKARRLTLQNPSRQLSAIRNLDMKGFDILAAALFDRSYQVLRAALIPHEIVLSNAKYVKHSNSWRFMLHDKIWTEQGVADVTEQLRAAVAL